MASRGRGGGTGAPAELGIGFGGGVFFRNTIGAGDSGKGV